MEHRKPHETHLNEECFHSTFASTVATYYKALNKTILAELVSRVSIKSADVPYRGTTFDSCCCCGRPPIAVILVNRGAIFQASLGLIQFYWQ